MWTREDDLHNGRFRPLSVHKLEAGFNFQALLKRGIIASPPTMSAFSRIQSDTMGPGTSGT